MEITMLKEKQGINYYRSLIIFLFFFFLFFPVYSFRLKAASLVIRPEAIK